MNNLKKIQTFNYKGKKYFIGTINVLDGQIEEVHTYDEAYNANFRHQLYFSPEQFKKINEDECVMFMTFDNKILIDPTGRTYLTEMNELFLVNKIKSEITFNENEYVEANGWGDYKYIEFDRLKSSTK